MYAELIGHLLLRQAGLDMHTRNMIVGASSGKYDVTSISNALGQAYRNNSKPAKMVTLSQDVSELVCSFCKKKGHIKKNCFKRIRREKESSREKGPRDVFSPFAHQVRTLRAVLFWTPVPAHKLWEIYS